MTKMKLALAAGVAALAMAGAANAEVFNLVNGTAGTWCACGASGTVTVTADGTDTFKVVVDLTGGTEFNISGKGFDATGFDLNGITSADISLLSVVAPVGGGTLADFTVTSPQTAGTNMEDGTGNWDYVVSHINGNDGAGSTITGLTYTVSSPGLTLADFVSNGTAGSFFVDVEGPDGQTGVVGTGPGSPGVPEPATWAMMLLGVFGVGGLMRRRREMAIA